MFSMSLHIRLQCSQNVCVHVPWSHPAASSYVNSVSCVWTVLRQPWQNLYLQLSLALHPSFSLRSSPNHYNRRFPNLCPWVTVLIPPNTQLHSKYLLWGCLWALSGIFLLECWTTLRMIQARLNLCWPLSGFQQSRPTATTMQKQAQFAGTKLQYAKWHFRMK